MLLLLLLASAAPAIQKPTPGPCVLEGVLVRHARIGKVGVLFDVATPFEAFVAAELAPGAGRAARAAFRDVLVHAEDQALPADLPLRVFQGDYDARAGVLRVEAVGDAPGGTLSAGQVEYVLTMLRSRVHLQGTPAQRKAFQVLGKGGLMGDLVRDTARVLRGLP